MRRRQLLQALGMGGFATLLGLNRSRAAPDEVAKRVVFFVTPHGHPPASWVMPVPGGSTTAVAERALSPLARDDFSTVLQPLHPFRDRLLVVEGLSDTVNLANLSEALRDGTDNNNHSLAVAGLLTTNRVLQAPGVPCTAGARSIDQELALRLVAPGRYGSRIYGADYVPNLTVAPFSFLGAGQAAPLVSSPQVAYHDLLGLYVPPPTGQTPDRAQLLAGFRPSVLDTVAREYELLASRLDAAGRERLDSHRALVRDLETNLGVGASKQCDTTFDPSGHKITQFTRLIRMAFACDLTRVITFVVPVPQPPEFGYPADATVHFYAHRSIPGGSTCGAQYDPVAERAMFDLGAWYGAHFAFLLEQLDAVAEGNGTMLDNTLVVWLTELATPTHLHNDAFVVLAGGGNLGLRTGRYVRYPRDGASPLLSTPPLGPAMNRLHVSILAALGEPDTSFGLTSVPSLNSGPISLTGRLDELF